MAWVNTPASISLVDEFNEAFPNRDRASDGTIGDGEHSTRASHHNPDETGNTGGREDADSVNEVHARDVAANLRRTGWSMERCVQIILARCRSGIEKRVFEIIYNGRIWTEAHGWRERDYEGSNPHDKHAHFSFRYGSGSGTSNPENITSPWGILAAIEGESGVSVQDVRGYFASAAKGVRGGGDATNIQDRKDVVDVLRFALGFNYADQQSPDFGTQLPPARFNQLAAAIAGVGDVDETALAAALAPVLGLQEEAVAAGLRRVLREGVEGE